MSIIGFDEVGRGALAGPVTVGLVQLGSEFPELISGPYDWVRDSKKMKVLDRQRVVELVNELNIKNVVLSASNKLVDEYGVGVCLSHLLGVGICYFNNVEQVVADGKIKLLEELDNELVRKILDENKLKIKVNSDVLISSNIERENGADDKYLSVAMASNLAKVWRDGYMQQLDKEYTKYDWKNNKGYGTKNHRDGIKEVGLTSFHRSSWRIL